MLEVGDMHDHPVGEEGRDDRAAHSHRVFCVLHQQVTIMMLWGLATAIAYAAEVGAERPSTVEEHVLAAWEKTCEGLGSVVAV